MDTTTGLDVTELAAEQAELLPDRSAMAFLGIGGAGFFADFLDGFFGFLGGFLVFED